MSDLSYAFDPTVTQNPPRSYPDWQQAIRAAQFEMGARADKEERARQEADKERQKKSAPVFKKILAVLGIEAEPTGDTVDIDSFTFHLVRYSYANNNPDDDRVGFEVEILPAGFSEDDLPSHFVKRSITSGGPGYGSVPCNLKSADWAPHRAALADALDEISAASEKARQKAALPAPLASQAEGWPQGKPEAKMVLDADTQEAVDFLKSVAARVEAGFSLTRHENLLFAFARFLALDSSNLDYLAGVEGVGMLR